MAVSKTAKTEKHIKKNETTTTYRNLSCQIASAETTIVRAKGSQSPHIQALGKVCHPLAKKISANFAMLFSL